MVRGSSSSKPSLALFAAFEVKTAPRYHTASPTLKKLGGRAERRDLRTGGGATGAAGGRAALAATAVVEDGGGEIILDVLGAGAGLSLRVAEIFLGLNAGSPEPETFS